MPGRSCRIAVARERAAATPSSHPGRRGHASGSRSAPSCERSIQRLDGTFGLAHGLDDAGAAVDRVAGREDLRIRRAPLLVRGIDQLAELVAEALADRLDDGVDGNDEFAPGNGLRPAAAGLVRLAEPHLRAANAFDLAFADDRHWIDEEADLDALFARQLD